MSNEHDYNKDLKFIAMQFVTDAIMDKLQTNSVPYT